ncbi:MAG TPA: ribonuclease P protein component [Planctomycetota bacterium]|nr:ribonuclease P protein component [Planctomycetota bacterium]
MASARFRRRQRISGDTQFGRIRQEGVAAGDGLLYVRSLPNGLGFARLGLAVGRAAGGAVARSRLRRQIREAFRACQAELPPGLDLLVGPRGGAAGAGPEKLRRSLTSLAARVAAELGKRPGGTPQGGNGGGR